MPGEVVRILVAVVIAQFLHQLCRRITQRQRHRLVACTANQVESSVNTQISRITLRRRSQIDGSLCQRDTPLGPAYLLDGIEGCVSQQQRIGIGQTDILSSRDDQTTGNELRVFPTLYHTRQPVERSVGVAATNGLDKGRDDVVVHLAVLVVGQRILLQTRQNQLVGNDDIARLRLNNQLQDVQQLTRIAATESQQGVSLAQLDMTLLENHVGLDGTLQQLQQIVLLQRLQHIQLTARQQRTNHLERRILGRCTYQRHDAPFYSPEQRVLLRLRETVNLVDKQDGRCLVEEAPFLSLLNDVANVLDATGHSRERVERRLQSVGNDLRQRGLAHTRWSPEDKRRDAPGVNHPSQHRPFSYQMTLPDVVIERAGTQSFC